MCGGSMNIYMLNIINNLSSIGEKIYDIYLKLSECSSNDVLYNKYKMILNLLLASEKSIYDSIKDDYHLIYDINELNDGFDFFKFKYNSVCPLIYDDKNNLINNRIRCKINLILNDYNVYVSEKLSDDLAIFRNNNDSLEFIKNFNRLLNEELFIKTVNNLDNEKDVINKKYLYVFSNPILEEDFLNNNLNIINDLNSVTCNSKYGVFNDYIVSKFVLENAKDDLKEILDFAYDDDFDINNLNNDLGNNFNILICSFKANLSFLNDNDIDELSDWVTFYTTDILCDGNFDNILKLLQLENLDDEFYELEEKLDSIGEYIENILNNVQEYRDNNNEKGLTL